MGVFEKCFPHTNTAPKISRLDHLFGELVIATDDPPDRFWTKYAYPHDSIESDSTPAHKENL